MADEKRPASTIDWAAWQHTQRACELLDLIEQQQSKGDPTPIGGHPLVPLATLHLEVANTKMIGRMRA